MHVNMRKVILCSRYFVFGVFIICNAIICSVAMWNFSIGQSIGANLHVDIFLTVLGALALLFVFPIGFVDILCLDWVTCRVWFECLWIGVFAILEFSGAVAVSLIDPSLMCAPAIVALIGNSCSSTKILIVFCWTCTLCLLSYFFLLLLTAAARAGKDPQIWHYKVRRFPQAPSRCLRSASTSPMFNNPEIVAPNPRRAVPAAMYAYRSGLNSQYQIEHFRPPTPVEGSPNLPTDIASWLLTIQNTRPADPAISFYPQHMQSILTTPPLTRAPQASISPPSPVSLSRCADQIRTAASPLHDKHADPAPTHLPVVGNVVGTSNGTRPRPKPTGPRLRTNSHDWRRLENLDPKYHESV